MRRRGLGAAATLVAVYLAGAAAWAAPPPEGRCPQASGAARGKANPDAAAPILKEGGLVHFADLLRLAQLLPRPVWSHRDAFFYDGMLMRIGSCHRRYPVPSFYSEATRKFSGQVSLDKRGNLKGYVAGIPFPPESIDPKEPRAALKWAWNLQHRYLGAGPVGRFKLLVLPGRIGKPQTYIGDFYYIQTGNRSDLIASDYRVPESTRTLWVAGGRFDEPFNARHIAWRQLRPRKADENWKEPDDTFIYVPEMRKPRRAATAWVDGLYTPRYRVAGEAGGGGVPFGTGGSQYAPSLNSIQPTAGLSIQASENIRRGFTGLAIRPNAYDWVMLGEREVLAPLNTEKPGWPVYEDRNYGPSGLSIASDRWDVRWAVVIRGRARRVIDEVAFVTLWIDWQTQQPLYYITHRKNGFVLDIGILGYQWSGDRADYPTWPGGETARVFDPVVATFYYVPGGGFGWRRESYDVRSVPIDPARLRKLTSTDSLVHGH